MSEEKLSEEEKAETAANEEMAVSNEADTTDSVVEETSSFDDFAAEIDAANEETEEVEVAASSETPEAEPEKKPEVVDNRRWYSLRVISGKERKIKERIELELSLIHI